MSTERAKKTITAYYEVRTRYRGFFDDLKPGTEFYELGKKYMYVYFMNNSIISPPNICFCKCVLAF